MNLSEGNELFIGNRQNGERPYRKTFPYPQKMQAFFAFRSGLHHSRKFDAAGVLLCVPLESTVHPALLRVTNGHSGYDPCGQPAGLVCLEVTKSAQCFWFKRSFAMPTSKTAKAVFVTLGSR